MNQSWLRRYGLISLLVVVAALVITAIAYLVVKPNHKSTNTAQAQTTQPGTAIPQSSAVPVLPKTASPAQPSTAAEVTGLAPFVGVWQAHQATLTINADGTGHMTYADIGACPSCSSAEAPVGTADFTLDSVVSGAATGDVTASNDEQLIAVGSPVTAKLAAGNPSGTTLQISMGKMFRFLCNKTSPGQCGA